VARQAAALRTALGIAGERLHHLAASEPGAHAATRLALDAAAGQLRTAQDLLAAPGPGAADARLEEVAGRLRAAGAALAHPSVASEALEPAEEWIAWALRRVQDHLAGESAAPEELVDRCTRSPGGRTDT
jgi:hypothetical protein